jgi:hypothetical protein
VGALFNTTSFLNVGSFFRAGTTLGFSTFYNAGFFVIIGFGGTLTGAGETFGLMGSLITVRGSFFNGGPGILFGKGAF